MGPGGRTGAATTAGTYGDGDNDALDMLAVRARTLSSVLISVGWGEDPMAMSAHTICCEKLGGCGGGMRDEERAFVLKRSRRALNLFGDRERGENVNDRREADVLQPHLFPAS
jgi:hypothetical protein